MEAAQMDQDQNTVSFFDVFVYLSPEEWELLDESQRRLYYTVILQNFILVITVGRRDFTSPEGAQLEPEREPGLSRVVTQPEPEREPGLSREGGRQASTVSFIS
uniref:KRAB domain-containing protein n=1 Tax=Prolemur simus TaxID=1328070 RepID=A0A8C8Z054_PROSS